MKGHGAGSQRFEDSLNVGLRSTSDAYVEIWKLKANEFIHELEDLFSRWWNGGCLRTLVEGIQDDVCRPLCVEENEHFSETFYHGAIARLLFSSIVCRIESGKYVTTGIGPSRKLDEERRKQIVKFLFVNVPEVKIKIGCRGPPCTAQGHDILYNRGTE
jgi:hypothetical protein